MARASGGMRVKIANARSGGVLAESKKSCNNSGDHHVFTSPIDKEDTLPGKWRWVISAPDSDDNVMISNAHTGGVLAESKEMSHRDSRSHKVLSSPEDKNEETPGKWRWKVHAVDDQGIIVVITNVLTGGMLSGSDLSFNVLGDHWVSTMPKAGAHAIPDDCRWQMNLATDLSQMHTD